MALSLHLVAFQAPAEAGGGGRRLLPPQLRRGGIPLSAVVSLRRRPFRISASSSSDLDSTAALASPGYSSENGISGTGLIDVDAVTEADLKENGFRSTRRTKLVCTIGPATCGLEQLEALASGGMNVARVNMCHGDRGWHREVIRRVRQLNEEKGYAVAVMMDTEGSEIHMGDLPSSSARAEVSLLIVSILLLLLLLLRDRLKFNFLSTRLKLHCDTPSPIILLIV